MTTSMTPDRRKTAADFAAETLRDQILTGALAAGESLPGERDLAERLGISRLTLRSALARLETEGLVKARHGAGTTVLDYREHGSMDVVDYLARLGDDGAMSIEVLRDLVELRRILAVEVLGLVAERATAQELEELRDAHAALALVANDPDAFMKADLEFGRRVVRSAHNLALELLFNTIARIIDGNPAFRPVRDVNPEVTMQAYGALRILLETRDPALVRDAARAELQRLDEVTLERARRCASSAPSARRVSTIDFLSSNPPSRTRKEA